MTWAGLTVDELRQHVSTELGDEALARLLAGAKTMILGVYPSVPGVEEKDGGQSYIFLRYPAVSITAIVETDDNGDDVELDEADYFLRDDRVSLLRLGGGPNPRLGWGNALVVYEAPDIDAALDLAQIALCELELNHNPGITGETIGSWSEQANSGLPYSEERDQILASLPYTGTPPPGFA